MSWICEYHFGNAVDTTDISYHESREEAIEEAAKRLTEGSKYQLAAVSEKHLLIEKLTKNGFVGDDNRCYRPEGLTCALVYHKEEQHFRTRCEK